MVGKSEMLLWGSECGPDIEERVAAAWEKAEPWGLEGRREGGCGRSTEGEKHSEAGLLRGRQTDQALKHCDIYPINNPFQWLCLSLDIPLLSPTSFGAQLKCPLLWEAFGACPLSLKGELSSPRNCGLLVLASSSPFAGSAMEEWAKQGWGFVRWACREATWS